MLSYPYSGARRVQEILAVGTSLACTSATGVIPLCLTAAETWQRVEGQTGHATSRLAVSTIRAMVTAQVTAILASEGKTRWCELATAPPSAAQPFLEVFPHAAFVCVHRCSLDVIRSAVQANPWGMQGQGLGQYLLSYPGNSVAALAAFWVHATEDLLAFETANPLVTYRVRYEDVAADPDQALTTLRASLGLGSGTPDVTSARRLDGPGAAEVSAAEPQVPVGMIPETLREHTSRLHAELGYPALRIGS